MFVGVLAITERKYGLAMMFAAAGLMAILNQ